MYPRKFSDVDRESAFLREFRRNGARFALAASLAGALMAFSFAVLMIGDEARDTNQHSRQLVRLAIGGLLSTSCLILWLLPRFAVRNYLVVVGVPAIVACFTVALLGYLPTDAELPRSGRLTVAMCLTCFLVYGFTRLPVVLMFTVCSVSSAIAIAAAISNGDDYGRALIIYLAAANVSGCVLGAQIERRERESFEREIALVEARERLAVSAQASSDASAAKSLLMAAVNHDLRQPAASAALYLERLSAEVQKCAPSCAPTVAKVTECVGAITDNLSRLSAVADLHDKDRVLATAPVDLRAILGRLVGVYSGPAAERNVRLVVTMPRERDLILRTDGARLGDVLANLVSNALKFSSDGNHAWVVVRAVRFGSRVRITVRDNGIGIEEQHHRRIFDEYFQVGNAERDRNRGYGLGLSIVRDTIVRLPNHSISFRSSLGNGTRFDIWVPLAGALSEVALGASGGCGDNSRYRRGKQLITCGKEEPAMAASGLCGAYVLLVEDDPFVRAALVDALQGWGMLVEAAESPEAAIALVRRAERLFDLVVSDFGFNASQDGLDLIREVRGEQGQTTPAIILSGQIPSIDQSRLRELQVRAVSKPIHAACLRAELDACLTSV